MTKRSAACDHIHTCIHSFHAILHRYRNAYLEDKQGLSPFVLPAVNLDALGSPSVQFLWPFCTNPSFSIATLVSFKLVYFIEMSPVNGH